MKQCAKCKEIKPLSMFGTRTKFKDGKRTRCKSCEAVDHNHTTGKIRDLLCGNCNGGLGKFMDNPELLIKAADYLKERHG